MRVDAVFHQAEPNRLVGHRTLALRAAPGVPATHRRLARAPTGRPDSRTRRSHTRDGSPRPDTAAPRWAGRRSSWRAHAPAARTVAAPPLPRSAGRRARRPVRAASPYSVSTPTIRGMRHSPARIHQRAQFLRGQVAQLADLEPAELDRPDRGAGEPPDRVVDRVEHPPDDPGQALVQHHLDDAAGAAALISFTWSARTGPSSSLMPRLSLRSVTFSITPSISAT